MTSGQNMKSPDLYKGMSRTFFSLRRRRRFGSRHPAPLTMEDARLVSCTWVVPSQQLHLLLVATTPISFETQSTMDLSEARGLVLFRVVRRGIGISRRLSVTDTCALVRLQAIRMLTLEPERLKNQPTTTRERSGRRWKGFFTRDAQAACAFSFSASKLSSSTEST